MAWLCSLCFFLFYAFLFVDHVDAQQCRLVLSANRPALSSSGLHPTPSVTRSASYSTTTASAPSASSTPFPYGQDTVRGVNLGGWFVLEPWITPSIFNNTNNQNIIDEYTFGGLQNDTLALAILQNHWDTWITQSDFDAIAAAGLNHVRIPLGYWSVPITSADTSFNTSVSPYIPGAWPYLLRALNWAKSASLHVILDLHGAPGSQNGYDNSGQRTNSPQWALYQDNVNRTLDILEFIVENVGGMIDIIELLNEPAGFENDEWANVIHQFWQDGYDIVRQAVGGGLKIMIGNGFLDLDTWNGFLTYPGAQGVLMDYHEYQIFSVPELERSLSEHISFACTFGPNLTSYASLNNWIIVGEWSTAPTDCATWLNGRGVGARWDGTYYGETSQDALGSCSGWTGDYSTFSDKYKTWLRQYWEVQVEVAESVQGWIYWAWKTEDADEWSYSKGLEGGWIPQDPTDRLYPNICNNTDSSRQTAQ